MATFNIDTNPLEPTFVPGDLGATYAPQKDLNPSALVQNDVFAETWDYYNTFPQEDYANKNLNKNRDKKFDQVGEVGPMPFAWLSFYEKVLLAFGFLSIWFFVYTRPGAR